MRSFMIKILTNSVARLIPFVENSLELLKDLNQFYNIGENIYVIIKIYLVWHVWSLV